VDGFTLLVTAFLIGAVLVFLAIGRYHPKSGADVLDWKPTRSHEEEVRLEFEDVDQMLEAQNERRRRAGRPEITENDVREDVKEHEREQRERSEQYQGHGTPPGDDR
jgi:NH3-dependent NAD+ synthetase